MNVQGVDAQTAAMSFAPDAQAPRLARRFIGDPLTGRADEGSVEVARLLVSELVTNSVRHSGLPEDACIEFSVRASAEVLMVEVADGGQGFDHTTISRPRSVKGVAEPSGWGLFLVDEIADRWGAVQMDGETRVWFELRPGAKKRRSAGHAVGGVA